MQLRVAPAPAAPNTLRRWAALVSLTSALFPLQGSPAQTTATVDVGASAVRYDGFLLSAAAALTPALEWNTRRSTLAVRGTYLRFESGNRSLQGSAVASLFTGASLGWRGELSVAAGASSYADFASFRHVMGEMRLHHAGEERGMWLAASGGATSFGRSGSRQVFSGSAAAWLRRGRVALLASGSRAFVGDTQYSDIGVTASGQRRQMMLETTLGARVLSHGAGRGLYGEASVTMPLVHRVELVLSGGRYPTDPIRGSIAGRYASAVLRLHLEPSRPRASPPVQLATGAGTEASDAATLTVRLDEPGKARLIVQAGGATRVELAADFTEWRPLAMRRGRDGAWVLDVGVRRGTHRVNIRIDGGPWTTPLGIARERGDFGDDVGVFVVP